MAIRTEERILREALRAWCDQPQEVERTVRGCPTCGEGPLHFEVIRAGEAGMDWLIIARGVIWCEACGERQPWAVTVCLDGPDRQYALIELADAIPTMLDCTSVTMPVRSKKAKKERRAA